MFLSYYVTCGFKDNVWMTIEYRLEHKSGKTLFGVCNIVELTFIKTYRQKFRIDVIVVVVWILLPRLKELT